MDEIEDRLNEMETNKVKTKHLVVRFPFGKTLVILGDGETFTNAHILPGGIDYGKFEESLEVSGVELRKTLAIEMGDYLQSSKD